MQSMPINCHIDAFNDIYTAENIINKNEILNLQSNNSDNCDKELKYLQSHRFSKITVSLKGQNS